MPFNCFMQMISSYVVHCHHRDARSSICAKTSYYRA